MVQRLYRMGQLWRSKVEPKTLISCREEICRDQVVEIILGLGLKFQARTRDDDFLLELLERDYDLIIYDLEGTTLDGLKMVKILRKIRPKIPVIVISNDPCKELGGKILHEGVVYYAVKPLSSESIRGALHSIVYKNKNSGNFFHG